ncbi:MAG: DUF484 family protein, partial [Bradyrhizobium sp.]
MTEKSPSAAPRATLSDTAVSDYLLANPDFFREHKKLLTRLSIPHPAGGAVSLVERQVEVLRQENRRLERRLVEWMEIARENDHLLKHLHALAVALLAEPESARRVAVLVAGLREDFEAAAVALILYRAEACEAFPGARHLAPDDPAFEGLAETLEAGGAFCRPLTELRRERIFPGESGLVSAAFVSFDAGGEHGVLVLASPDPK